MIESNISVTQPKGNMMNRLAFSIIVVIICAFPLLDAQVQLSGSVFHDKNKDSIQNSGEKGIKDIPVSNGRDIVLTDRKGLFHIVSASKDIIFIIDFVKGPNFGYNSLIIVQ